MHRMSDEDYVERAIPLFNYYKNYKNSTIPKSDSLILIEDIFFLHQGVINAIYTHPLEPEDSIEEYTYYYDAPVVELENGGYAIEVNEFNEFFEDLTNEIEITVDETSGEYLTLTSYRLHALSSGIATISIGLSIATPVNTFFPLMPDGGIMAVGNLEDCASNNWISKNYDASGAINYYQKEYGKILRSCPTGQTAFIVGFDKVTSSTIGRYYPQPTYSPGAVLNQYLHMSNTFDCIGDDLDPINNEAIWNDHFQKAHQLADDIINNIFVQNNNIIWINPSIRSGSTFTGQGPMHGYSHYHNAVYHFARIICI